MIANVTSIEISDSIIASSMDNARRPAGIATINGNMPTVVTISPGKSIRDSSRTNTRGKNITVAWSDNIGTRVDTTVHAIVVIPIATFIFASTTGTEMKYLLARQPAGTLLAANRNLSFSLGSGMPD